MKSMKSVAAILLGGVLISSVAIADTVQSTPSACVTTSCGEKQVQVEVRDDATPGRFEFRAEEGECVVVRTSQAVFNFADGIDRGEDTILRVNGPRLFDSYFNDDISEGNLRSQIVINPVVDSGVFSVNVDAFGIDTLRRSLVTVRFARYTGENPRCANPTTAQQRQASQNPGKY